MWHPIKHFITITRHRHKVIRLCFKCGIFFQGLKHDLSKYSWTEFKIGMKYYTGTHSPNSEEIKEFGYSKAWLHHKGRNKHHFEYWMYHLSKSNEMTYVKIPIKYMKEMFCDRVAATKIYMKKKYTLDGPLNYFNTSNDIYVMNEESSKLLLSWLLYLKEHGEKETCKYIKKIKSY